MKNYLLYFLLLILLLLFSFSVFKNISYPLLWNDEAETAVFAERILKFGFPKVHDGKNILNLTEVADKNLGVNTKHDAWIHLPWGQYYLAAPGVFLARKINDLYIKTAVVRIPFALVGTMGVLLLGFSIIRIFKKTKEKYIFITAFLFLETLSTSLLLHLREVRSYSLNIFLFSLLICLFIGRIFIGRLGAILYNVLTVVALLLLLNSFPPAFFAVLLVFAGYLVITKNFKELIPFGISAVLSIPFLIFFKTFAISIEVSKAFGFNTQMYFHNLKLAFYFFSKFEYLSMAIMVKLVLLFIYRNKFREALGDLKIRLSLFLTVLFISFILIVSRVPYFFERYIIPLQPVLISTIVLDLITIEAVISKIKDSSLKQSTRLAFLWILFVGFTLSSLYKLSNVSNHIYELFHPYKGPMDYAISYIKGNFKNPENLVIATNYEEPVYMYYLGSKVTIGYVGNNLEEDAKIQPDMVILRRGRMQNVEVLNSFLKKADYKMVVFPVYDYYSNNIPELTSFTAGFNHLFKTPTTDNLKDRLTIYIKK